MMRLISSSSDDFFTSDDFIVDALLRVFYPTIHPDDMLQWFEIVPQEEILEENNSFNFDQII